MATLELGVVLSEHMEADNAVNVRIPDRNVVSRRTHLIDIHETLRQSEQDVSFTTMSVKHNRDGRLWPELVKELVQLLACPNLGWWVALCPLECGYGSGHKVRPRTANAVSVFRF